MSAYVVENETINRVVAFLATNRDGDYLRRIITESTGCDLLTHEGKQSLGLAMLTLNCNAVDQRYGKGESKTFRDDMSYSYRMEMCGRIQAYKSLKCWLYQCNEGDVPDMSLLYATMQRIAGELADDIVCSLPEYDKAKWD